MRDQYSFPLAHWVMVGLSDNGQINADDWLSTEALPTYSEKNEHAKTQISRRIREKGFWGVAKLSLRKMYALYRESDLQPGGIIPFAEIDTNLARLLDHTRKNNWLYKLYNALFLYGGLSLALISVFSKGRDWLAIIAFAGLMMFFLVWEVNPKYMTNFLLVIIYMATIGVQECYRAVLTRARADNKKRRKYE